MSKGTGKMTLERSGRYLWSTIRSFLPQHKPDPVPDKFSFGATIPFDDIVGLNCIPLAGEIETIIKSMGPAKAAGLMASYQLFSGNVGPQIKEEVVDFTQNFSSPAPSKIR